MPFRLVGPAEGLPEDLDRLDRVGQALEGQLPERPALVAVAPTGHGPDHVGRQDLAALARRTEPGRLDDRVPEVVVVLPADLAPAQPDPQAHRVLTAAVVPFDALLHGHGTAPAPPRPSRRPP